MAKQPAKKTPGKNQLVAKSDFQDGLRVGGYKRGDVYEGPDAEKHLESGLLMKKSEMDNDELVAHAEDQGTVIKALEQKVEQQAKEIGALKQQLKQATTQNHNEEGDPGHTAKVARSSK